MCDFPLAKGTNLVQNVFLTHQREPGVSLWGIRVMLCEKEAALVLVTLPPFPTHLP